MRFLKEFNFDLDLRAKKIISGTLSVDVVIKPNICLPGEISFPDGGISAWTNSPRLMLKDLIGSEMIHSTLQSLKCESLMFSAWAGSSAYTLKIKGTTIKLSETIELAPLEISLDQSHIPMLINSSVLFRDPDTKGLSDEIKVNGRCSESSWILNSKLRKTADYTLWLSILPEVIHKSKKTQNMSNLKRLKLNVDLSDFSLNLTAQCMIGKFLLELQYQYSQSNNQLITFKTLDRISSTDKPELFLALGLGDFEAITNSKIPVCQDLDIIVITQV